MLSSRVIALIFFLFCACDIFSHDNVNNLEGKSAPEPSNESQLIFAHVLYRHGQRNTNSYPDLYPNDPYINESHWPGGFGALTNEDCCGFLQMDLPFFTAFPSSFFRRWMNVHFHWCHAPICSQSIFKT
ncbi:uncharacterized protein LOC116343680 [Contarinia nasturtii]|uniref:uncharacterized protein LOC116343680 n=1 Tax=Contarinia nasturtii TaxID=265458 RepID=UPI0012D4782E|nr:uncharacterized protein LOC116343680 [Contarinia nasturtii]